MSLLTRFRVTVLVSALLSLCSAQSATAQWRAGAQWRSASGDLVTTVVNRWGRSCASGTAQSTYQVKDGAWGEVYPIDCDNQNPDYALSRFEDKGGAERCVGTLMFKRVDSNGVAAAETTWNIEAPVKGYRCSTVGQSFKVKVFYREAPPLRS